MRTTLTIEDHTVAQLKNLAHESGKSFKQVVNETLRRGLEYGQSPQRRKAYKLKPVKMGEPRPEYDLTKALALADNLENSAKLCSADYDFKRFPGLVHFNPLV